MDTNLIIYILGAAVVVLLVWLVTLEMRLKKLLSGRQGVDLEELIIDTNKEIERLSIEQQIVKREINSIWHRLKKSIRAIKTHRFNPFSDAGSNQSFATAFIDDHGDGVVISSLYSRDRVGIYAKPVLGHKSEYDMTDEEKVVIEQSKTI